MKNGYMKQYGLALVIEFEWKKKSQKNTYHMVSFVQS